MLPSAPRQEPRRILRGGGGGWPLSEIVACPALRSALSAAAAAWTARPAGASWSGSTVCPCLVLPETWMREVRELRLTIALSGSPSRGAAQPAERSWLAKTEGSGRAARVVPGRRARSGDGVSVGRNELTR